MSNLSTQFIFPVKAGTTTTNKTTISPEDLSPEGTHVFYSLKEKGDGYHGTSDGLHTVTYTVGPYFNGSISMQGSLATTPTATDWFQIKDTTSTWTALATSSVTNYVNFTGNFVWVRAKVSKTPDQSAPVLAVNYNH